MTPLAIVDCHHHLWTRGGQRYLLEEFAADVAGSGQPVTATVYVESGAMSRRGGPEHLRCVGEAEFAAGMAAMSASGAYGPARLCAAFVGAADLALGAAVDEVLDALALASGGRLRGIRAAVASDPDPSINAGGRAHAPAGLMMQPRFREGVQRLAARGLAYDAWQFHPQLPEVCSLADAFPDLAIVVNHCGGPLGIGRYSREETYGPWKRLISELARRPNVHMKLGGMARRRCGFDFEDRRTPPSPEELAGAWRPYMEHCIEQFGARRCMYGSNFPPDKVAGSYGNVWAALRLTAAHCSEAEQRELFGGTAARVYRLDRAA